MSDGNKRYNDLPDFKKHSLKGMDYSVYLILDGMADDCVEYTLVQTLINLETISKKTGNPDIMKAVSNCRKQIESEYRMNP